MNQSDLNTKGNNRILSDTLIYVLSTVIQSGVQLLFIPYLTRVLSLSEYGEVELFITLNGLFNIAILFGVNTKIYEDSKRYNSFSLVEDRNEYKCEKYGLLFYNGLVLIIASLLINLFYDFKFIYLIYASVTSAVFVFVVFEFTLYQIQKKAMCFLYSNLALSLVSVVFTIILVSAFKQGAEGRYLGGFVSVAGLFVYFYIKDRPKKIKLSLRSYFTNMKLLLPLAFTSIFSWLTESVDKIMVNGMLNLESLAIYSVGYKFGMIMLLVTSALSRAWMPYVIENENKIKEVLVRLVIFSLGMFFMTAIYIVGISLFFYKIVPVEYHVGAMVAYIITLAYFFDGVTKLINAIFIVKNKTSIYIRITIFSGGVNIVLNFLLIPLFGYIGSAYATLLSFLVAFFIAVIVMCNFMRSELVY